VLEQVRTVFSRGKNWMLINIKFITLVDPTSRLAEVAATHHPTTKIWRRLLNSQKRVDATRGRGVGGASYAFGHRGGDASYFGGGVLLLVEVLLGGRRLHLSSTCHA
jgi:hypothetical protein